MAPLIFDFLDVAFKIFYSLELESEEFRTLDLGASGW